MKVVVFNKSTLGFVALEMKAEGLLNAFTGLPPDLGKLAEVIGFRITWPTCSSRTFSSDFETPLPEPAGSRGIARACIHLVGFVHMRRHRNQQVLSRCVMLMAAIASIWLASVGLLQLMPSLVAPRTVHLYP